MTPREVSSAHFPTLAATLLADHTVVAFSPATSDFPWAADVVWEAARALARTGRRVGLVDLCLDQPVLHRRASGASEEGIVDALIFGVSLGHVVREQEPHLYFIGAGTTPPDAEAVYRHERWRRLGRGFRHEGALLLLFVPPSALERLQADLDGLVVLAPSGYAAGAPTFPAIGKRVDAGVPLLAVVRQGRVSSQVVFVPGAQAPVPAPAARLARRRRPSRAPVGMGLAIGAVAVAGVALLALYPRSHPLPPADARPAASSIAAARPPAAARPAVTPPAAADAGDSLFYSVQVAAYNQADQAAADADRLRRAGAVTVSPVRLGDRGVWYRVMVGVLPTPATADSLLRWLWSEHLVERPNGTILRTPHANALAESASPAEAQRLAEGLRRRGIAAYIVPAPGGMARVLAGAFEAPDQARAADSLLQLAGLKSTLVLRTGTTP